MIEKGQYAYCQFEKEIFTDVQSVGAESRSTNAPALSRFSISSTSNVSNHSAVQSRTKKSQNDNIIAKNELLKPACKVLRERWSLWQKRLTLEMYCSTQWCTCPNLQISHQNRCCLWLLRSCMDSLVVIVCNCTVPGSCAKPLHF